MSNFDSTEEWRAVVGYEGLYEVSSLGRVRSLGRKKSGFGNRKPKMMTCYVDSKGSGYRCVGLTSSEGKNKKRTVHVIVLEAFVGPRPSNVHEACHEDGDRTNAVASNLRWDTPEGNWQDRVRHGRDCRGAKSARAMLTEKDVELIRKSPLSSIKLGKQLGVASSTVRAVRIGQNWSYA